MTDVLSTIFVLPRNPANNSVGCLPLRHSEVRVYAKAAIGAMQPHEHPDGPTVIHTFDLTNPAHLRALAFYIEENRW